MLGFAVPTAFFTISGTTSSAMIPPTASAHCIDEDRAERHPALRPPTRERHGEHDAGDHDVVGDQHGDEPHDDRRILPRRECRSAARSRR